MAATEQALERPEQAVEEFETIVIGGGQAGLSLGYYLKRLGQRFVILEFPTLEAAQAWWDSPEYAPAKALRQSCADTNMLLVEGKAFDPNQALIRALSNSK